MDGIGSRQNPETAAKKGSIRLLFLFLAVLLHVAAFSTLIGRVVWPATPLEKADFAAVPLRASLPPPVPSPDLSFTTNVALVPEVQNVVAPTPRFQPRILDYLFGTKPKSAEADSDGMDGFAVPGVASGDVPLLFLHERPPNLFRVGRGSSFMWSPSAGGKILSGDIRVGDVRNTRTKPAPTGP